MALWQKDMILRGKGVLETDWRTDKQIFAILESLWQLKIINQFHYCHVFNFFLKSWINKLFNYKWKRSCSIHAFVMFLDIRINNEVHLLYYFWFSFKVDLLRRIYCIIGLNWDFWNEIRDENMTILIGLSFPLSSKFQ